MEHLKQNGIHGEGDVWRFYSVEEAENHNTKCENWKHIFETFKKIFGKTWFDKSDIIYVFNGVPVYRTYRIIGVEDNNAWCDYYWILEDEKGNRKYELSSTNEFYEGIIKTEFKELLKNKFKIFTLENLMKIEGFTQERGCDPMTGTEHIWLDYCKRRPHVAMVRDRTDDLGFCFENDKLQYIEYFYQEDNPYDDYDYIGDEIIDIDDKDTDETIIKKLDDLGVPNEILISFINSNKV